MTFDLSRLDVNDLTEPERVDLCFKAVKTLELAVTRIDQMWRETAKLLRFIKTNKLYKHYSSDVSTWQQFIRSVNLGFDVGEADHYCRVSEAFEEYLEDRTIKITRLLAILPVVTPENREELLDACAQLPLAAFRNHIGILKGRDDQDVCGHEKTELWERCKNPKCGKWLKKLKDEPTPEAGVINNYEKEEANDKL